MNKRTTVYLGSIKIQPLADKQDIPDITENLHSYLNALTIFASGTESESTITHEDVCSLLSPAITMAQILKNAANKN